MRTWKRVLMRTWKWRLAKIDIPCLSYSIAWQETEDTHHASNVTKFWRIKLFWEGRISIMTKTTFTDCHLRKEVVQSINNDSHWVSLLSASGTVRGLRCRQLQYEPAHWIETSVYWRWMHWKTRKGGQNKNIPSVLVLIKIKKCNQWIVWFDYGSCNREDPRAH